MASGRAGWGKILKIVWALGRVMRSRSLCGPHETIAGLLPPHPAARADVHQVNPTRPQGGGPPQGVPVEGVAAIHQDVSGYEVGCEGVHRVVHRLPGRDHEPHGARREKRGGEFFRGVGGTDAGFLSPAEGLRTPGVPHHVVACAEEAASHPSTHPAEAYKPDLHLQ
jgi:hypothetical protein